jgi:hypothetical protein
VAVGWPSRTTDPALALPVAPSARADTREPSDASTHKRSRVTFAAAVVVTLRTSTATDKARALPLCVAMTVAFAVATTATSLHHVAAGPTTTTLAPTAVTLSLEAAATALTRDAIAATVTDDAFAASATTTDVGPRALDCTAIVLFHTTIDDARITRKSCAAPSVPLTTAVMFTTRK